MLNMIINFNGLEVIAIKFTKSDIIMGYRISVHNIQHYYTAWLTGAECRIGNGEKLKQQQRPSRGRSETHLLVAAQIFPAAQNFPTVSFEKKTIVTKRCNFYGHSCSSNLFGLALGCGQFKSYGSFFTTEDELPKDCEIGSCL